MTTDRARLFVQYTDLVQVSNERRWDILEGLLDFAPDDFVGWPDNDVAAYAVARTLINGDDDYDDFRAEVSLITSPRDETFDVWLWAELPSTIAVEDWEPLTTD